MRESTKKANPIRRFGARVIGIVTGANRDVPALWEGLAECDLAEFRADLFGRENLPGAFLAFRTELVRRGLGCGTVLTLRLRRDGGAWPDAEATLRAPIWEALGNAGGAAAPDWIDIEIEEFPRLPAAFREALAASGSKLLLSHHDFAGCPPRDRLRAMLREMLSFAPAGVKFAVTCADRPSVLDLMAFARDASAASSSASVFSMGATGRATRVLAPALGCPFAYGFLTGPAVAPGQLSAPDLASRLDDFSSALPRELLAPGAEPRLLDWAEARLQGVPFD